MSGEYEPNIAETGKEYMSTSIRNGSNNKTTICGGENTKELILPSWEYISIIVYTETKRSEYLSLFEIESRAKRFSVNFSTNIFYYRYHFMSSQEDNLEILVEKLTENWLTRYSKPKNGRYSLVLVSVLPLFHSVFTVC